MEIDEAPLDALYKALEGRRPRATEHFAAKIRQTLQRYPEFRNTARGVWARATGSEAAARHGTA